MSTIIVPRRHRNPQSTRTEEIAFTIPIVVKPNVKPSSCHGKALWPAPIIGERALSMRATVLRIFQGFASGNRISRPNPPSAGRY